MQTRQLQKQCFGTCSCAFTALFGSHPQWLQSFYSLLAHRRQHLASTTLQATTKSIFCSPCWLQSYFLTLCGSEQHSDSQLLPANHEFNKWLYFPPCLSSTANLFHPNKDDFTWLTGMTSWTQLYGLLSTKGRLHTTREKVAFLKVKVWFKPNFQ